ncbi:MAG: efflux RND transporter periplasmic adaptor subunit [Methylococcaceae bacterium]
MKLFKPTQVQVNNKVLVLSIMYLFLGFISCSFAESSENTVQLSEEHIKNLGVTLGKPVAVSQIPLLVAPAKVVIPPSQEYIVSASQSGLITRLTAAVADTVKKGGLLAQINSPDLLELQGQYLKAGSVLQLAATAYSRDKKLLKDGVIANKREQETLSQYNAAVLDVNQAKQLLAIAGMSDADITRLNNSHRLNSQLNVYAPISGVIIERMAVAGTRVDSLAPLYRLANLDQLWLDINIPQERINDIKVGDKALIENTPVSAEIKLLGENVDPENQTLLARAVIKSSKDILKAAAIRAGQKINVQIIQASNQAVFSIPNTAIAQNEGKSFIFIRNPSGFAVSQISIIGKQGETSIIKSDLTGDEDIAIKGAVALKANWLGLGSDE